MDHITIGTAGHVDHGKTTLIKALTGIETDTTEEEKERGMSINIGFAYFDLPDGRRAGIVDVPGHEKFIKNMMAGLAGLNLVLLVIDASEGIMPQTREHIDILQLLGIKDYIIVLTKVGTVDKELLELVEEDMREEFKDTHLEHSPIIKVDSISGTGLSELKQKIDEISHSIDTKNTLLPPRLHVDRVFSVKGFGTVVTGTLIEGKIKLNDELMIYPSGIISKIRGIQVHGEKVTEASAGQRTALNLANVKVSDLKRGDLLAVPNAMESSWMLDVKVKVLPHASPVQLWDRLRLHIGTKEVLCRAVPLGVDEIKKDEEGFLQLRLEEKAVALQGDKCIIRTYSPMRTIAGAVILDANPAKHKRFNERLLEDLKVKESGKVEDLICDFVAKQSKIFTTADEIVSYMGLERAEVETLLEELKISEQLIKVNDFYLHGRKYAETKAEVTGHLSRYHKTYRLRSGMPKEELRSKFGQVIKGKEFDLLLQQLATDEIVKNGDVISLYEFVVTYNPYQLKDKERIEKKLKETGFLPPSIESLTLGKDEARELIESLNHKTLVRLDADTVIHSDYYQEAVEKVHDYITKNGKMTLAEFRDMVGSSRKYSMIILEYMDKQKITRRVEETRVLY